MRQHFVFHLKKGSTVDEAIGELDAFLDDIYELDDPETSTVQIGGYSDEEIVHEFTHVVLEHAAPIEEIDWEKQWTSFAPGFHHGLAHIDLSIFGGPALPLKPGGGFGDFSHPTTRLCLSLMAPRVKNKQVFDIGCGSGILSIAAVLLGANRAIGIDIEEEALAHSQENAVINHVEEKVLFAQKIDAAWLTDDPCVIVMNMIESEQQAAWQAVSILHSKKAHIITSGILSSQKEHYLKLAASWNWSLKEEREEEGWIGFVFTQNM